MGARNKDHEVVMYKTRYVEIAALQFVDFIDFLSHGGGMSPLSCAFAMILSIST